jgi:hypothetical protein
MASNIETGRLKVLADPDVVVMSKPELFDKSGNVRDFIRDNKYLVTQKFLAFEILKPGSRPGHSE